MSTDLSLECSCGAVRGAITDAVAERGHRVLCYCDDCQAFAHYLGRADEILDGHGGTDIVQISPARLEITEGIERLAACA